jgi:acyl-CoA thioesterase FadM
VVTSFERAKFFRLVRPGDQLELAVEVIEISPKEARFKGQALRDGKRVASSRFTLALTPATPLEEPEEARRHFDKMAAPLRETLFA